MGYMEEERLRIHFIGDVFREFEEIPGEVQVEYLPSSDVLFERVADSYWSNNHIVFIAFLDEKSVHRFVKRVRSDFSSLFNSVSLIAYLLGEFSVKQELVKFFDYMLFHPLDQRNLLNIIHYVWMKKQQLIVEKKLYYLNGTIAAEIMKGTQAGEEESDKESDLYYAVDDKGIIQTIDDHILRILGFTPEEIIGHHFSEIIAHEEFEDVKSAFSERRTGERSAHNVKVRMRKKDGDYEEFSVDAEGVHMPSVAESPDRDPQRIYVGTLGRARRKGVANAALDVFNSSQLPLIIYDPEKHLLRINGGFERFSGYNSNEVTGIDPQEFEKEGHTNFQRCLDGLFEKEHCSYTTIFMDKNGSERLCEVFLDIVDYDGRKCVLGMYKDISVMMTVLDEAEMLIQLSWIIGNSSSLEELLEKTVSQGASILNVPIMLCAVLDEQGKKIKHCYYQSASAKVRSCTYGDEALDILFPLVDEAIRESKTVYRRVEDIEGFDRARHLLELGTVDSGTFVVSPLIINQKVIGSIMVLQGKEEAFTLHRTRLFEISTNVIAAGIHKLHLESELRRSLDSLEIRVEERTRDLEDFVYTVSHDLKSPLHAARGFANMIRKQFTQAIRSEEDAFVLRRVEENIEQALQMIDKLLQLSRIGTRELKFEQVDLNEIVNNYFVELNALKKGQVKVHLKIREKLPVINADHGRMVQLFTNLFDNSVKYMGGDSVSIEVSARRKNGRIALTVQDDGIGIDERDLPNIFKIFYRGHCESEREIPEGAGVGLSIVKKIVDQHGGTIEVSRAPSGGTVVHVELPEHS